MPASGRGGWTRSHRPSAPRASTSPRHRCSAWRWSASAATEHRLILTGHHILMDGWSLPVLVRELFTLYGEARDPHRGTTTALPRPTPYRDYLAWIAAQDRAGAEAAWRQALAGLEGPTFVAPRDASRSAGLARADLVGTERGVDCRADPADARPGTDPQQHHPGRLGDPARPADRPRRRGVRRHGGGPAARDRRHRDHGGAVHQHPAAARSAAARPAARRPDPRRAGAPVAADGAPASRAVRGAGAGRPGRRAVRHRDGVRELSGGRRGRQRRARPPGCASPASPATTPRIIRSACRQHPANGCGCGSTTAPTCSSARPSRPSRHGSNGCWPPR